MTVRRLLLAACAFVTVGCSVGSPATDGPSVPEVSAEVRALHRPFEDYQLSRLDLHTIEYAEDLITRDCMRKQGMDWVMLPPPSEQDPDPLDRRRYGLIEPVVASRFGYHIPPPPPELAAREAVWTQREQLPPAQRRAAYGEGGAGGCRAQARHQLRAGVPDANRSRLYDYSHAAFEAAQREPEMVQAIAHWSECMAAGGARYADPFEPFLDPAWKEAPTPSEEEVRVAETDVRCKQQTGLVRTWSQVEQRVQRGVIEAHRGEFDRYLRAKEAELDIARRVIQERA